MRLAYAYRVPVAPQSMIAIMRLAYAKRNISHQFKSLINSLTIGYFGLPIFSPIVALGFGRAKFLFGGRRPSWPPLSCGPAVIA